MFDFIRTHQRMMQFVLLLVIFPSFAFLGLEGYSRYGGDDNVVATVGGQPITSEQVNEGHRQQVERLRQMFGGQIDARMFDTPAARQSVLEGLVAQRALSAEVARNKLSVPDQVLQQNILAIPDMVGADGKFDGERYKALLAGQGMTPAIYESRLRQDLAQQQLSGAIENTVIAPKSLTTWLAEINEQEREVQELRFKAADFSAKVKLTDAMLKDYYDKNPAAFEIPEQVKAEYVVLSMDTVAAQISVGDADIKAYYDQNQQRYSTPEQRRASHILVAASKSAPAAEKSAAKDKAAKLLEQLRKSRDPAEFARLAKANSQDPGSAEKGGDLGFFGPGMMVKPFEEAAFKLKPGEMSDLVESDFGYHIIKLTEAKPGGKMALEQVKADIAGDIKKQLAAKKFTEMAETFSNTVYEQADSLKPVADKLGLKIETVAGLTRAGNPAAAKAVYNNPKFLGALFGDDAVRNKRNTEAVEVAASTLIAGRVIEHKPAAKKPFDEVKPALAEQVTRREAQVLASKAGQEKLAALQAKPDSAGFGEVRTISRSKNPDLRGEAATAILKADVSKLPAFVGTELPGEGYGVYRIGKVGQPAKPDAARRTAQEQQVVGTLAQEEMTAYVESLKKKAKVKFKGAAAAVAPATDNPAPEKK
ncbi:SurA N-terminal domain-containing protein [Lacisediminimonas sp.]|uniref:SurA N-terminal domain-containing protein n=1 Tax=Lacisediminimonas sp. TaxID=3060582 RepID=UPI002727CBCC|nr:SurA N-terminal domain-containing protein [Lacisediminimonas sp.]MDO8300140.1 SurA N-terminal domain-containing protein [Lacisediminimonas sp.]